MSENNGWVAAVEWELSVGRGHRSGGWMARRRLGTPAVAQVGVEGAESWPALLSLSDPADELPESRLGRGLAGEVP